MDLGARLSDALDGRFAVEEEVGRGGMSVVFRARDVKHDRHIAIKVLRPELSALLGGDRFHREVEYAARLNSPYILPLFDSGEAGGCLYYLMPFVPGGSLSDRLERDGSLPVDEALDVALNVACALVAAHEHGIIHRDIKPGNILFSGDEAVVADFGVARAVAPDAAEHLTRSGVSVGSPAYMSPEQGVGDPIDERSDVYSLGCVMYAMLTGHPPFVRDNTRATIAAHLTEPVPSIREERPEVPRAVDELVQTALQKDPEDRFASAAEMVSALEHPDLIPERARTRRRRTRVRRALTTLASLAAAVTLTYVGWRILGPESLAAADPNGVMVFPLVDLTAQQRLAGQGSGLAAGIGYALEETRPLRWLDGWDWLTPEERSSPSRLTPERMRQISRRQGAAYYVHGTAVDQGDSLAIVLRLFESTRDGPQVARSGQTLNPEDEAVSRATLRALGGLLPTIVGESVDVSNLVNRDVRALANWTVGLSMLRNAQYESAFTHFQTALEQDSMFALAGVDGAVAAMGISRIAEAQQMADAAIAHDSLLSPRHRHYAHGIRHYTYGRADSTVRRMQAALRADTTYTEAWFALGEAFLSLMPSLTVVRDLAALIGSAPTHVAIAEAALRTSLRHDPTYSPSFARLAHVALLNGDTARATDLIHRFLTVDPDSTMVLRHTLVLRCTTGGMTVDGWARSADAHAYETLGAAVLLSRYGEFADCAEDGYRAILASATAENYAWGAVVGLQSLLVAQGRTEELKEFLAQDEVAAIGGAYLYPLDAAAGADVAAEAEALAASVSIDLDERSAHYLWVAGEAAALSGDTARLAGVFRTLSRRVAEGRAETLDSVLTPVFAGHLAAARGDTTRAIDILSRLEPQGTRQALQWNPWTPLAPERLRLAELLYATGRYEEAIRVAELLDHPWPVLLVAFQPAGLSVRIRAHEALGNPAEAASLRQRAAALGEPPGTGTRADPD